MTAVIQLLGNRSRETRVGNTRRMDIACTRMTMDYRSRVSWKGHKGRAGRLYELDETGMRKLGGHYRSPSGVAIMVENDMKPATVRLNERQTRNLVKLLKKPGHPLEKGIQRIIRILGEDEEWGGRGVTKKAGKMRGVIRLGNKIKGKWKEVKRGRESTEKGKKREKKARERIGIRIEEWNKEEEK